LALWIRDIKEHAEADAILVLIGNQIDLPEK